MRSLICAVFAALLFVPAAGAAPSRCGDDPGDASAVADARAQMDTDCPCAAATSKGLYARCAHEVAKARVAANLLRRQCKSTLVLCAGHSICGRPAGAVTCCRPTSRGPRCTIKKSAASCTSAGGAAGACPSCCDGCPGSCPAPPVACGNSQFPQCDGTCASGEQCATNGNGACACIPDTSTACGDSPFPQCDGACAGSRVCQAVRVSDGSSTATTCECVDAGASCGPGTCTGPGVCSPGMVCSGFSDGVSVECGCTSS